MRTRTRKLIRKRLCIRQYSKCIISYLWHKVRDEIDCRDHDWFIKHYDWRQSVMLGRAWRIQGQKRDNVLMNVPLRKVRVTISHENTINITYSKCVSVALFIQHAKRKCHIMMILYYIWYDMIYDVIWYDIWYDMTWYDMIWYDILCDAIWHDMTWYMIWYVIWYDIFVNCNWVDTRWQ